MKMSEEEITREEAMNNLLTDETLSDLTLSGYGLTNVCSPLRRILVFVECNAEMSQ
jgi:hypothetical protein